MQASGRIRKESKNLGNEGILIGKGKHFFSRNRKCKKKLSLCSYLEYASSTFQHLPPTLPCHVHLRHLRNEFLHECQAQRNPRLGLQLRDFRTIHDITIPGKKFFNLITLRTYIAHISRFVVNRKTSVTFCWLEGP